MYLKRLSLINFKNIGQEEFPLTPGINCFVGDNGAGKTNFIDAIHYLSMCKSAFSMTDTQSVRHGEEFFLLEGSYERSDGRGEQIVCSFARRGGKTLKRNGKEYDRLSDHVGLVPVVIVSPADTALVSDAADERRRYLNGCISQLDRGYLSAVMRYNAVLSERNRYLKVGSDEDMLSIYDRQLAEHGQAIYEKRKAFAERLQPLVGEYYALLSGRREQVELTYRSELAEAPFTELLQRARQRDLANQFTTAGIHRDDLVLRIDVPRGIETGAVPHRRCRQGGEAHPAARRSVRQAGHGACRTTHQTGVGGGVRADRYYRLQQGTVGDHSRAAGRRLSPLRGGERGDCEIRPAAVRICFCGKRFRPCGAMLRSCAGCRTGGGRHEFEVLRAQNRSCSGLCPGGKRLRGDKPFR